MRNFGSCFTILFSALVACEAVDSAPVSLDDPIYGTGAITYDPASGLEWLDIPLTTNLSYDYLQTQFGLGGQYEGFRHATESELASLLVGFGFSGFPVWPQSEAAFAPAQAAVSALGLTCAGTCGSFWYETVGRLEIDPTSPFPTYNPQVRIGYRTVFDRRQREEISEGVARVYGYSSTVPNSANQYVGHFLVRDALSPVPLPGTLTLLAGGILGLMFPAVRRRAVP